MYPTRLNTSWPDKQLLLRVTGTTGDLTLKDRLRGAAEGSEGCWGWEDIPLSGVFTRLLV